MNTTIKTLLAAAVLANGLAIAAPAFAGEHEKEYEVQTSNAQTLAAAGVITKAQAVTIAVAAVGGGTVVRSAFEKGDRILHWSVDIVNGKYDYEVWVGTTGKVLRVITQPR